MAKDNKNSPIFLLSLVDFFIQITFLFVILFCIYLTNKSTIDEKIKIYDKTDDASKYHGYKTPIDLINDLTSLSPTNFSQLNEVLRKISPKELKELLDRAGGKEGLNRAVDKQFGSMPCEYDNSSNGKIIPKRIATFAGTDNEISLVRINEPQIFNKLLAQNNIKVEVGESIPITAFTSMFAPIKRNNSHCIYYVNFIERTEKIHASRAIWSVFGW